MEIKIQDGKYTINGELQPPVRSKTGKSYVVASTGGFIKVVDNKGKEFSVALNIITKESK